MKITSLEVIHLSVRYREPLTISFHTFEYAESVFLKLTTDSGLVGWGESAPFKLITGDSVEEVKSELSQMKPPIGAEVESGERFYLEHLASISSPSLRAAFDFAIHDLLARERGVPVFALYERVPKIAPNSVTVFIKDTLEATAQDARRIIREFPHLEIMKIKLKGEEDRERCSAIKRVVPPGIKFVLDANQGFEDPDIAVRDLNAIITELGEVLLVEEPCPKGDHEKSRYVKERIRGSFIVADETCCDEEDVDAVIREGSFHGFNIKLQKAGGITVGMRMARRAATHGMKIMVGQMFESPLSTSAGVHFASVAPGVMLTDLDMDLDIPDFSGGMTPFANGARAPLTVPGFGFSLDEEKLAELSGTGAVKVERLPPLVG